MELGRFRNLLEPENRRYIPLAAYGLIRGLAAAALRELAPSTPKHLQERQAASIQYYSTPPAEVIDFPERPDPNPPDICA